MAPIRARRSPLVACRLWLILIGLGGAPACTLSEPELESTELVGGQLGGLMQTVFVDTHYHSGETDLCTGILLGPRTLLTAAHCVANRQTTVSFGFVTVPATGQVAALKPGRIYLHPTFFFLDTPLEDAPRTVWDVAVVALADPVQLPISGSPWAVISDERAIDGQTYWLNGRKQDGQLATEPVRAVAQTAPLSPGDPTYPFQLLDAKQPSHPRLVERGDSGGPLFREPPGEPNDGMGGSQPPGLYGLVSRGDSYARLDPIAGWIRERQQAIEVAVVAHCPVGVGPTWVCSTDARERLRCENGITTREICAQSCTPGPNGSHATCH